jgi:hypothetical protein|nr:MAG TPA: hypothetical protein [Caudoviricetes sp.]
MSNFKGYLLRAVRTDTIFPNDYILYSSWKSTPNQREEIKAYRDDNTRELYRVTAEGQKSIFQFDTIDGLSLQDKINIQNFFTSAEINTKERKVQLEFWNEENNQYSIGYFYRPNMEFTIQDISEDDITYSSLTFEFVEY